jgi:hypothetical protein
MVFVVLAAVLVTFAAAAGAQPAEEFCVIRYTPNPDFSRIVVDVDLEPTESDLRNLTAAVDADSDGMINASEVVTYEENRVEQFGPLDDLGVKKLFVDGYEPWNVTIQSDLIDFEGPVNETGDRRVKEIRTYRFNQFEADWYHFLHGGLYSEPLPRVAVEFVVLEAPPGWVVWRVNETEYGQPTVSLRAFDTHTQFEVVYAKEGRTPPPALDPVIGDERRFPFAPVPGPDALIALAALAIAGVWVATRRT